jgi:hypothetical protein
MWTLGIGYINVSATVFGYVYAISTVFSMIESSKTIQAKGAVKPYETTIVYVVLNAIEIVLLIIWQSVENPRSIEKIVDPIKWETIYTCAEDKGIMFTIQLVYFVCVCLWGSFVLYRFIYSAGKKEDFRFQLMAFNGEMWLLGFLIIILQLSDLDDDNLYVLVVSCFLLLNGIIIVAYALPRWLKRFKRDNSSDSSKGKSQRVVTTSPIKIFRTGQDAVEMTDIATEDSSNSDIYSSKS